MSFVWMCVQSPSYRAPWLGPSTSHATCWQILRPETVQNLSLFSVYCFLIKLIEIEVCDVWELSSICFETAVCVIFVFHCVFNSPKGGAQWRVQHVRAVREHSEQWTCCKKMLVLCNLAFCTLQTPYIAVYELIPSIKLPLPPTQLKLFGTKRRFRNASSGKFISCLKKLYFLLLSPA